MAGGPGAVLESEAEYHHHEAGHREQFHGEGWPVQVVYDFHRQLVDRGLLLRIPESGWPRDMEDINVVWRLGRDLGLTSRHLPQGAGGVR